MKNATFLLIDDDEDEMDIFCGALEKLGNECLFSGITSGRKAVDLLSREEIAPDYIFIDLRMPDMNGGDCLKEIKKLSHLDSSLIFIYSIHIPDGQVEDLINAGATDCIPKPSSERALSEILSRIMSFC